MAPSSRPKRYVVRSASAVLPFWLGMVVLAIVVATALVNDVRLFSFVLPIALLLAWVFWLLLFRPAVHYDSEGAVVVNIGRVNVLPWGHVVQVRQGIGLIFDLDTGKKVTAVGTPAPRRSGNVMSNFDRRTRPPVDAGQLEADMLDSVRRSASPATAPVITRWDGIPLLIGAVLAVTVLLVVLTKI